MAEKTEWVKQYMVDRGCSKQAAYKAWDRYESSEPFNGDLASRLDALEARVVALEAGGTRFHLPSRNIYPTDGDDDEVAVPDATPGVVKGVKGVDGKSQFSTAEKLVPRRG